MVNKSSKKAAKATKVEALKPAKQKWPETFETVKIADIKELVAEIDGRKESKHTPASIEKLATLLKDQGLINKPRLMKISGIKGYYYVDGRGRCAAMALNGAETITCPVWEMENPGNDKEAKIALVELARRQAFFANLANNNLTQNEIVSEIERLKGQGKKLSEIAKALNNETISRGRAAQISTLEGFERQTKAIKRLFDSPEVPVIFDVITWRGRENLARNVNTAIRKARKAASNPTLDIPRAAMRKLLQAGVNEDKMKEALSLYETAKENEGNKGNGFAVAMKQAETALKSAIKDLIADKAVGDGGESDGDGKGSKTASSVKRIKGISEKTHTLYIVGALQRAQDKRLQLAESKKEAHESAEFSLGVAYGMAFSVSSAKDVTGHSLGLKDWADKGDTQIETGQGKNTLSVADFKTLIKGDKKGLTTGNVKKK